MFLRHQFTLFSESMKMQMANIREMTCSQLEHILCLHYYRYGLTVPPWKLFVLTLDLILWQGVGTMMWLALYCNGNSNLTFPPTLSIASGNFSSKYDWTGCRFGKSPFTRSATMYPSPNLTKTKMKQ